ncbi:MAG: glutathione peroxidase [Firmicutes bacterium HGW-Firmicutes-10]|jgi:glutathione peroxidase|nr:MAG: glutathione peroxidase [Firmicutes bacterium HGW-Firmicutes-10]
MSVYQFSVKDAYQKEIPLSDYKGKVLLIVNTATKCGLTPQYAGLEKLYESYNSKGFEVLDFPCNQFMNQAPGSDEELSGFCQLNYGTTFKTLAKIDINGDTAHQLYKFLKSKKRSDDDEENKKRLVSKLLNLKKSANTGEIKWNFTKFLVDRNGEVVERFAPTVKPEELAYAIERIL